MTFLTPAGKRVLEGDLATLKTAKGALNPVILCVSTVAHCMKAVRLLQQKPDQIPTKNPLCLSLFRLRQNGFDRTKAPETPLMLPVFVKLQVEARAWSEQQKRASKQPFQSPF
jgi:hypothetical protein